jgi:transketolase
VRPLDEAEIVAAARETGAILTAEEHQVQGGLGGAIAEVVVEHAPVPMRILGVPGVFAPTGSASFLLDRFGMSPQGIAASARELLARKRPVATR